MMHELKTWTESFQAIVDGKKTHEVRRADRDFRRGDFLHLREYEPVQYGDAPGRYTGREMVALVTYVTGGGQWDLPVNVCVMSIRVLT